MNVIRNLVCAALAIAVFGARNAAADSLAVLIDTSWRAIGPVGDQTGQGINNSAGLAWEASHVGWNNSLAFDDSAAAGWTNAIQVTHPNPPNIRFWVDGTDTVGSSPAYFRREFDIPGIPSSGLLDFNVDDDAFVYVNGQIVFSDANGLANDETDISVMPYLHSGINLIAVKAHDQQGAQSIAGRLDIVYQVPEPNSLVLSWMAVFAVLRGRNYRVRR
jgi:hypothetical protein